MALTIRESGEKFGAVKFALRFQKNTPGAVPNRAASVDSSLPAGWRPTPYDRLVGTWHAVGVADHGTEVEEEFVLKAAREQLADGSWSSSCTGGNIPGGEEDFAVVALRLEGAAPNERITFIQRYPDGAETHWAAVLAKDHGSMHSGTWNGACNGTFACTRTIHETAPVPQHPAQQVPPNVQPPAPLPAARDPTTPRSPRVQPQTKTPPAPAPAPAPSAVFPLAPERPPPAAIAAALAGAQEAQQTLEKQADRFEELSQALERAMQEKAAQVARIETEPDGSAEQLPPPEAPAAAGQPEQAPLSAAQLRRQRQLEAQRRHAERLGSP